MAKFYFTYGTDEEFPFRGGWSEVEADNLSMAVEIFNLMHPKRKSGCVNCAFWYTEEQLGLGDVERQSGTLLPRTHFRYP